MLCFWNSLEESEMEHRMRHPVDRPCNVLQECFGGAMLEYHHAYHQMTTMMHFRRYNLSSLRRRRDALDARLRSMLLSDRQPDLIYSRPMLRQGQLNGPSLKLGCRYDERDPTK